MCCRYRSRNNNILKFCRFIQACCYKKYKQNLNKLRRLQTHRSYIETQLCSSKCCCKQCNDKKCCSSNCCIDISPVLQESHLPDQNRNNKTKNNTNNNKYQLTDCNSIRRLTLCGKPCDHDHSRCDQHTHIIDNQSRNIRVDQIV